MKNICTVLLFLFSGTLVAQQRIGADLNTRLGNAHFTVQYHRVIKGSLLLTSGLGGGYHGFAQTIGNEDQVQNGFFHNSYRSFPQEIVEDNARMQLTGTDVKGSGITGFVGIGFFKEFKNFHGFRCNVNHTFSWMRSKVRAFYKDYDLIGATTSEFQIIEHPLGAVSLELYHTIRINGRWTFYWGAKLPYYYSLDKARYDPRADSELFHKFLFDASFGFSKSIGKCD